MDGCILLSVSNRFGVGILPMPNSFGVYILLASSCLSVNISTEILH